MTHTVYHLSNKVSLEKNENISAFPADFIGLIRVWILKKMELMTNKNGLFLSLLCVAFFEGTLAAVPEQVHLSYSNEPAVMNVQVLMP
jgi:hypothetical protein